MKTEEKTHSLYSGSGAARFIGCPGAPALCQKVSKKSNRYADEGTAAHGLAELCLRLGCNADHFLGQDLPVGEDAFEVTEEMVEGVNMYVGLISSAASASEIKSGAASVHLEITLDALADVAPGLGGTADAAAILKAKKRLKVYDFKYGRTPVEPRMNPQLMIYGLGVLLTFPEAGIEEIDLVICQPRAPDENGFAVKTWSISAAALVAWAESVLKPALARCADPAAPRCPGAHCHFCGAMAICPERTEANLAVARTMLPAAPPPPESLTPDQICQVLVASDIIKEWAAKVRGYAQSLLEGGQKLRGWKLVLKRSNRKWIDEDAAGAVLADYLKDGAFERKILSPAKAEKALKKAGACPEEILGRLAEKPDAGIVIAPETDRRAAVASQPFLDALEMFD